MNKIILIGRVGKTPEVVTYKDGKVAKMTLAVSERFNRDGEKVEEVEWFNLKAFGKLAEIIERYVGKGDKIAVVGKYKTREYEKEGEKKYFSEVIVGELEMLSQKQKDETATEKADRVGCEMHSQEPIDTTVPDDGLPF